MHPHFRRRLFAIRSCCTTRHARPWHCCKRSVGVLAAALLAWPLTLPSDPSALRYVAAVVPVAVIVTIGIVLCDVPDLYQATEERGDGIVQRIIKATVNGQFLIWLLLACLGIGGYLSWGSATKGDFLLNYPQDRPEIWMCRLMLAIIVYCVLPVATLPTAKSVAQLLLSAIGSNRQVSGMLHAVSATLVLSFCTATALKVS